MGKKHENNFKRENYGRRIGWKTDTLPGLFSVWQVVGVKINSESKAILRLC